LTYQIISIKKIYIGCR